MKGSLLILIFFLMGCLIGYFYTIGFDIHEMSVKVLYVLMLLLGMNLGGNQDLKGFVAQFNFKMLLVPIATVSGTFLFSAIAGFILSQWSVFDCMAVGSGFAYYSISSVLITQLKTPSMGLQVATELGTIALLANIFREMTALVVHLSSGNILDVWLPFQQQALALPTFCSPPSPNTPEKMLFRWPSCMVF